MGDYKFVVILISMKNRLNKLWRYIALKCFAPSGVPSNMFDARFLR